MADPFDVTGMDGGNADAWRNLMQFGLATMAAGSQPGARTLGALGQGGMAAMQSARENATARSQAQLYGAEAQSKQMSNMLLKRQVQMQSQGMGLPDPFAPQQAVDAGGAQPENQPAPNSTGMSYSPSAGTAVRKPQMIATPTGSTDGGAAAPAPQSGNYDTQRLAMIGSGRMAPSSPEEAGAAQAWATAMGYPDRAKELNTYALAGNVARSQEDAKYQNVAPNGTLIRDGKVVATGAQEGVTPEGMPFRAPGQMVGTQPAAPGAAAQGNAPAAPQQGGHLPLGIRNNNPGNIRPNGQQWQGMTGTNQGYMTFDSPESGIRAISLNLRSYGKQGINTPLSIAQNWAPAQDKNNPAAYAQGLAGLMHMRPDQPLNLEDPKTNALATAAIMQMENSQIPYKPQQFIAGVQGAFAAPVPQAAAAPAASRAPAAAGVPPAAPGGAGMPPGAIQTGLSPQQQEYQKGQGKSLADFETKVHESAAQAQSSNYAIDNMRAAAKGFKPDAFGDYRGDYARNMQALAHTFLPAGSATKYDKPAESYTELSKDAGALLRDVTHQLGGRSGVQELQMVQKTMPGATTPAGALNLLTNQMMATNDFAGAQEKALADYKQAHAGSIDGFQEDFRQRVSPTVFLVHRLAQTEPQQLKLMRDEMVKTPAGKKMLDSLVTRVKYADTQGYFDVGR